VLRPDLPAIIFLILGGAVDVAFGGLDAGLKPAMPTLGARRAVRGDA
jgi:hypothetical protein